MKIAVCEDNATELAEICSHIRRYCKAHQFKVDIDTYSNAADLLAAHSIENYKIIFLDIIMDDISGIDAAHRIRAMGHPCIINFITVSKDHSLDAYSVDGSSYLLKPVSAERMNHALDKCRREFFNNSRYITIPVRESGIVDIPLANICYTEVYNKTVLVHLINGSVLTTQVSLSDLEKKLGGDPFLRCHRSYIINMNHIKSLSKGEFLMKNGDKVLFPLRSYAKIQMAFGNYLTHKLREDL